LGGTDLSSQPLVHLFDPLSGSLASTVSGLVVNISIANTSGRGSGSLMDFGLPVQSISATVVNGSANFSGVSLDLVGQYRLLAQILFSEV
jgi:hypothetical protein